jgi:hypothetical protein
MKLKKFIEFLNETNQMTASSDGKEFVKKDMDSFIEQKDVEKQNVSKPAGKKPLVTGEDRAKPILNTTENIPVPVRQ